MITIRLVNPGQEFSSGFVRPHGQIRKPFDDLFVVGLCCELFLESWFQIRPGELSLCPVKHVSRGKEPFPSKAFEGIGHVRIGSGVGPVVCSCQILNLPDEDDSCYRILSFLSLELWYLRLVHWKSKGSLGSCWDILYHLARLVLVEVELNVVVIRHPSCLERMFTFNVNVHGVESS
jgi:hypothetical protein